MRPRRLEIEGLQSFKEKQAVDFDRLGETGLFGIFGPTGSGKSTILDAITLALYGNVQRAARGTQGIINTSMDAARVSFAFDLGKNTGRHTYRVERVYRRKKDSEASAEIKIARLFEIRDGSEYIISDKPGEVTARVEGLIGLKLDDFTRSVVLPQNRFQEFLLMEKAKKREMLERIFYLEEYGRQLYEKAAAKISSEKLKMASIIGEIAGLGDINEKTLIDSETRLSAARSRRDELDVKLKLAQLRQLEAKEIWQLVTELRSHEEKSGELELLSAEYDQKRDRLARSLKAEGLSEIIRNYDASITELDSTAAKLAEITEKCEKLTSEFTDAKREYETVNNRLESERPQILGKIAKLEEAAELKSQLAGLEERLGELRKEYLDYKAKLNTIDGEISLNRSETEKQEVRLSEISIKLDSIKVDPEYRLQLREGLRLAGAADNALSNRKARAEEFDALSKVLTVIRGEFEETCKAHEVLEKNVSGVKQAIDNLNCSKPCERSAVIAGLQGLLSLGTAAETISLRARQVSELETKRGELQKAIESKRLLLGEAERAVQAAETAAAEARRETERVTLLYGRNAARMLAADLAAGKPCPVCGSLEHPSPCKADFETTGDNDINKARERQDEAGSVLKEAEKTAFILKEQSESLEMQCKSIIDELADRTDELNSLISGLPEELKSEKPKGLLEKIDAGKRELEGKLLKLEEWEKEIEAKKQLYSELMERLSAAAAAKQGKLSEMEATEKNLLLTRAALSKAEAEYRQALDQYKELLTKLGTENIAEEVKRLDDNDIMREKLQKEADSGRQAISGFASARDNMIEQRQLCHGAITKTDEEGRNLRSRKEELGTKIKSIAGEEDPGAAAAGLERYLKELEMRAKEGAEKTANLEKLANQAANTRSALDRQREIHQDNRLKSTDRLNEALRLNGFETREEALASMLNRAGRDELGKDIADYDRKRHNLEALTEMTLQKLGERKITEEEWSEVNTYYENMKSEKDQAAAAFGRELQSFETIRNSFSRWLELERQRKLLSQRLGLLEQLQKLLKGNGFVEYISEERLRYIAREASETLGALTGYKYALELDSDNGFVIRDNSNGGVCRAVTSLSGGETFLTSLSLALALSEQIQLKGQSPLEFFFLDEGFGTLDSSLLDNVMDSLEKISTTDRVIGLISHVPELRNRVARRLVVIPPAVQGAGSRTIVEKA